MKYQPTFDASFQPQNNLHEFTTRTHKFKRLFGCIIKKGFRH